MAAEGEVLDAGSLNRATLARQHLLERRKATVVDEVRHLVGQQAQVPFNPYTGLFARLAGFKPERLSRALLQRKVCRIVVMRSTIHLVTAEDAAFLRPLTQLASDRSFRSNHLKGLKGHDPAEVAAAGRRLVEQTPMTFESLGKQLAKSFPGCQPLDLAMAVRVGVPLVQVTPRGVWGQSMAATHAPADQWLGIAFRPPEDRDAALEKLVLRYLGAFGPATVQDAQVWAAVTGLKPAFERLRASLVTFRDARGRELFDLPRAPRPEADSPAPPRFMPEYDNLFLAHADRSRLLDRPGDFRLVRYEGTTWSSLLLDGRVGGGWWFEADGTKATLTVKPFRRLGADAKAEVREEGMRLLGMLTPEAVADVRFATLPKPPTA